MKHFTEKHSKFITAFIVKMFDSAGAFCQHSRKIIAYTVRKYKFSIDGLSTDIRG